MVVHSTVNDGCTLGLLNYAMLIVAGDSSQDSKGANPDIGRL